MPGEIESNEVRAVPANHALAWYAEAMRLWKRAPFTLCVLGFLSLASEFALQLVPDAGMLASKIFAPIVTCGMYIATHSLASGGRAHVTDAVKPFAASASAIAAIVVSSLAVFAAEALTACLAAVLLMFAVGVLVSLPFTLVALCVLLDGDGFARAFRTSFAAFTRNMPA